MTTLDSEWSHCIGNTFVIEPAAHREFVSSSSVGPTFCKFLD